MSDVPLEYSRDELIAALQLDPAYARRFWNAFGFAQGADGDGQRFSKADLAALSVFAGNDQAMDSTAQLAAARAIGQATARLAQWQAEEITRLAADPNVEATTEQMVEALARVQDMVWRRHLAAGLTDAGRDSEHTEVVVGFADIVGYTSMSRRLGMTELESLLETFESAAHAIITGHGGQIIKTIGDAVMFTVSDPTAAAEIAIDLHGLTADGELPSLRIGMARGDVLMRMGDAFGEPVNIAARLASSARSTTTLIDDDLASALRDLEPLHVSPISSLSVRGYRKLRAFKLVRDRNWKR
ncbi:adenylate/guanylate cyclase domain-containing protein [Gordonia neofelifaecis]|uniref:Adenylyl cyclase class-3/4/guanylyl cyclase n=1 Tax=Gordonia neofelifaecis NRRL B-59395 TaxID=644548 RepID=F1YKG2_9ACTN|nr:adenylate/guanylate cyclase domain-containing protein [Gordonia neofelifaecis]EGD54848.1 adenylyl cyclase class-3/4/guanylyl cyclase [Gordonia neofelifaecis NRRL B-59395]